MNDFIGKNYTVPQLDLSVKPENTAEKYAYLYEQTVVDDSESGKNRSRHRLSTASNFRTARRIN